ncbi:MAG: gamma-glutamylcyclotransferase [Candidatus Thiosymbion ectosymbiont of Robbea hypermnestra]|nr:gamma-glutamylcyclotransferase [Candidatus Thiosymbion ectosymbiont of Robbea hypermnestra]
MSDIFYLAYGSNLHPLRLRERIPSSSLVGTIELIGYRLMFHKLGRDKSGKCNILHTNDDHNQVFAALFKMAASEKVDLDRYEDDGDGYRGVSIDVSWKGTKYTCLTYLADSSHIDDSLLPYEWYRQLVILGAEYLNFPRHYVEAIYDVGSISDPDKKRRLANETLVRRMELVNRFKGTLKNTVLVNGMSE